MAYAEGTSVAIEKSMGEIVGLIKRKGAARMAPMEEPSSLAIRFFMEERMIRFRVRLPGLKSIPERTGTEPWRTDASARKSSLRPPATRARALASDKGEARKRGERGRDVRRGLPR
ncbi:MAG: hypothetical protein JWO65_2508 [Sphingomonas bacterium]|nr:hypothetical protein [Sphingomonas bacterium]